MPFQAPTYRLQGLDEPSNAQFARTVMQMESLPLVRSVVDSTGIGLTTSDQDVPSLKVDLGIPGGAYFRITSFLDLSCDAAAGSAVANLYTAAPGSTYSIHAETTAQIVLVGTLRATFGQTWCIKNPGAGTWSFQVRARKGIGAGVAQVNGHNTLVVEAI